MISFGITTHNETDSLVKLIEQILKYKQDKDELVIVDDYSDKPTMNILYKYCQYDNVEYHQHALNKDFASQKNYLKSLCRGEWVVAADADESISEFLLENIHYILENNDIDILLCPRINTVEGIGLSHVKRWEWNISKLESQIDEKIMNDQSDEYQLLKQYNLIIEENKKKVKFYKPIINAFDPQQKIYKNKPEIKWVGKVHERLEGATKIGYLPYQEEYCYYHIKTIQKQKFQNAFYDTIER